MTSPHREEFITKQISFFLNGDNYQIISLWCIVGEWLHKDLTFLMDWEENIPPYGWCNQNFQQEMAFGEYFRSVKPSKCGLSNSLGIKTKEFEASRPTDSRCGFSYELN